MRKWWGVWWLGRAWRSRSRKIDCRTKEHCDDLQCPSHEVAWVHISLYAKSNDKKENRPEQRIQYFHVHAVQTHVMIFRIR
jgi:hypothetical protein